MRRILFFMCFVVNLSLPLRAAIIDMTELTDAIYGSDDRRFVDSKSSPRINELSQSIALIISKDNLENKIFKSRIKAQLLTDAYGLNLCREEKFAGHHSVNGCTGFLIAPDLLVSAGHCFLNTDDCANKKIIFNVRLENETKDGYAVPRNAVYECREIVRTVFDIGGNQDFAIIRLNKNVTGRKPLKLSQGKSIGTTDHVFMIGHPLGLPLVSTSNAQVNDISNDHFFKAPLDSFEGNSGSPVFNSKTFEVEGILVRGEEDFIEDRVGQCYRNQVYDQGLEEAPSKGEGISRISEILLF